MDDRAGWVRGCVHAAAVELLGGGLCTKPGRELLAAVEATYQQHRRELAPLAGTDRIWRRLAQLHREDDAGRLF